MPRGIKNQSLTIAMFVLFALSLVGMIVSGHRTHNADQRDHGESSVGVSDYLASSAFIEALFENWESEFLQMGGYVLLTAFLYQKGSAESKDPDAPEQRDEAQVAAREKPDAPWPVQRGGVILRLYENSLSIALLALFVISFALHLVGGASNYNEEQRAHGGATVSTLGYLATSQLWFESLQNWQSEFLSVGVLVVLSIFLRQRGSPESKRVTAAHSETGAS